MGCGNFLKDLLYLVLLTKGVNCITVPRFVETTAVEEAQELLAGLLCDLQSLLAFCPSQLVSLRMLDRYRLPRFQAKPPHGMLDRRYSP
jgi:hypothetical protein